MKTKPFRYIIILCFFLTLFTCKVSAELANAILVIEGPDRCRVEIGFVAVPMGPLSYYGYIKDDNTVIKGVLVNKCDKIDSIKLALAHYHDDSLKAVSDLRWEFSNLSKGSEVEIKEKTFKNNDNINFSLFVYDVSINGSKFYSQVYNNIGFGFDVIKPVTVVSSLHREIDFSDFLPRIKDDVYLNTKQEIEEYTLSYHNLSTYIFVEDCKANSLICDATITQEGGYSNINIKFDKPIEGKNKISLSYYMQKFLKKYEEEKFPSDDIVTEKITSPHLMKVKYSSGKEEKINDAINIQLLITIPPGFTFDKIKAKEATGTLSDECGILDYDLPQFISEKAYMYECETDTAGPFRRCVKTNRFVNATQIKVNLFNYVTALIEEPQIQIISSEKGNKIIYTTKGDYLCSESAKSLYFIRGPIFNLLYRIMILISTIFLINVLFIKRKAGVITNFLTYLITVIFTIYIQFLTFPRPANYTKIESWIIRFIWCIAILSLAKFVYLCFTQNEENGQEE